MATIRMRRNKKGRFVARAANPKKKHSRKRKHNYVSAGAIVPMLNPKRRHKRNPPLSLPLPGLGSVEFPIDTIIGVSAGIAGPPIVEGFARQMLPAQAAQYPTVIKIGAHLAVLGGGYLLGGRKGLRDVAIGEAAAFVVKGIQQLAAQLQPQMSGTGMRGYVQGTTTRRQMGGYTGPTSQQQLGRQLRALPGRLAHSTASRFQSRFRPA